MWIWESKNWPHFTYDRSVLAESEKMWLKKSGEGCGAFKCVSDSDRDALKIELITDEATKTSEIEGQILNRNSVQSSLRKQMGLSFEQKNVPPAEDGIASMMTDLYKSFGRPLDDETLFRWHRQLMNGQTDQIVVGAYRTGEEPMQIVAGNYYDRRVYYEAPPSERIPAEMRRFIDWFNSSKKMNALERAGIAHLYFVLIHPFDDGNGRISRALAEKSLSQSAGQPALTGLATVINAERKKYYATLEAVKSPDITEWLLYFAETVLAAQEYTLQKIDFVIQKTKLYDRVRDQLNARQDKAVKRMFKEGLAGFKGGLSADNYMKITGASPATATRDLADLVEKKALYRTGVLRHTRYFLNLTPQNSPDNAGESENSENNIS